MRIAVLAPLWKEVPPPKYGGTELIVSNITDGLVKKGCKVTLFACGGSQTKAQLVQVIARPMYDLLGGFSWAGIPAYEFLSYKQLFDRISEFDIIHNHMGFAPLVFSKLLNIPIVTTLHSSLPPDFPYLAQAVKDNLFISISNAQRSLAPYLNYIATVYHGIDVQSFVPDLGKKKDYLLFMGSLTKNKGIDLALQAAIETGEKLIIAGEIRNEDKVWLQKEVLDKVDGHNIKFVGEVGHKEKNKLYAGAKALLFPIRWNEAFGLVMPESLACGTPVLTMNNGSVPEIIEDGVTGFIASDYTGLVDNISKIGQLSRAKCREEAEKRFDISVMAKNYHSLFAQLIQNHL